MNQPQFHVPTQGGYTAIYNTDDLYWVLGIVSRLQMVGSGLLFWTLKQGRLFFLEQLPQKCLTFCHIHLHKWSRAMWFPQTYGLSFTWDLLEMLILRTHPRPTESETHCFNQPVTWWTFKFNNYYRVESLSFGYTWESPGELLNLWCPGFTQKSEMRSSGVGPKS